jgi:hypothetical protein
MVGNNPVNYWDRLGLETLCEQIKRLLGYGPDHEFTSLREAIETAALALITAKQPIDYDQWGDGELARFIREYEFDPKSGQLTSRQVEFATYVYKDEDGYFRYRTPWTNRMTDKVFMSRERERLDAVYGPQATIASIHSHLSYSSVDGSSGMEEFSGNDLTYFHADRRPGMIVAPNGDLRIYAPAAHKNRTKFPASELGDIYMKLPTMEEIKKCLECGQH